MSRRVTSNVVNTILSTILIILNSACTVPLLSSTPTSTATSTETPSPTNTIPPPTKTATPNLLATQSILRIQAIQDILNQLELDSDSGDLGWFQTRPIAINIEGPEGRYTQFADNLHANDFVIYTQMTWDTNGWPWCGIWFRVDNRWDKGDFYMLSFLRLSGLPAFDIEYIRNGLYVNTITEQTRFSSFLDLDDGATNEIVLAAVDNVFKIFINGIFEGRYYDYSSKLARGQFAFYGSQSAGITTCSFENTWIWVYK